MIHNRIMLQPNVDLSGIRLGISSCVYKYFINVFACMCVCVTVVNTQTSSNIKLPKARRKNSDDKNQGIRCALSKCHFPSEWYAQIYKARRKIPIVIMKDHASGKGKELFSPKRLFLSQQIEIYLQTILVCIYPCGFASFPLDIFFIHLFARRCSEPFTFTISS